MPAHLIVVFALFLSGTQLLSAEPSQTQHTIVPEQKIILGWLEQAYAANIPIQMRAKLDSGAKTSSIHGVVTDVFEKDNEQWLAFTFDWLKQRHDKSASFEKSKHVYRIEAPVVRQAKIKNHHDPSDIRWVVKLPIFIAGRCTSGEFSIANREKFNYPILLGREYLKASTLIDPSKTFTQGRVINQEAIATLASQLTPGIQGNNLKLLKQYALSHDETSRKLPQKVIRSALESCDSIGIHSAIHSPPAPQNQQEKKRMTP